MSKDFKLKELSSSFNTHSNNNLKPLDNVKNTSTSQKECVATSQLTKRTNIKFHSNAKIDNNDKIDNFYIRNLQAYVKELTEENLSLKDKNSELEALLAAAKDELEQHEESLLEISKVYEELETNYKKLLSQVNDKKVTNKKAPKIKPNK